MNYTFHNNVTIFTLLEISPSAADWLNIHWLGTFFDYAHHIYDDNVKRVEVDDLLNDIDGHHRWVPTMSNECGCSAHSNNSGVKSTDTINCIPCSDVPK